MPRVEPAEVPTTPRRVLADSLVYRLVAGTGRAVVDGVRRFDAALGRVPLPPPDPADELRAKRVLTSSRLVAWIDRALDVPERAWESSAVRRALKPTLDQIAAADAAGRLRAAASVLLIAAATHIALVLAFAEPVGWPTWVAWTAVIAMAAVAAGWPREVVAAWNDSAVRRRLQRRRR